MKSLFWIIVLIQLLAIPLGHECQLIVAVYTVGAVLLSLLLIVLMEGVL